MQKPKKITKLPYSKGGAIIGPIEGVDDMSYGRGGGGGKDKVLQPSARSVRDLLMKRMPEVVDALLNIGLGTNAEATSGMDVDILLEVFKKCAPKIDVDQDAIEVDLTSERKSLDALVAELAKSGKLDVYQYQKLTSTILAVQDRYDVQRAFELLERFENKKR